MPWLQVDDLRLAFQRSQVTLPEHTDELYFFDNLGEKPHIWTLPPDKLRDALIATGQAMSDAIAAVAENHLAQQDPVILEGDGILPSIINRPALRPWFDEGQLRIVFIVESDQDQLLANIQQRNRGLDRAALGDVESEAEAKWLFGNWLMKEANRFGLPVVEGRPWDTLIERVSRAVGVAE